MSPSTELGRPSGSLKNAWELLQCRLVNSIQVSLLGTIVRASVVPGKGFDEEEISGAKWPEPTHIYFHFGHALPTSDYEFEHQKQ
jgi:hypothetical protein